MLSLPILAFLACSGIQETPTTDPSKSDRSAESTVHPRASVTGNQADKVIF